jgi:hypothetical protein
VKQYRFRINEFERIAIVNALNTHLYSWKKLKEQIMNMPAEKIKEFHNISSNEITKEDILVIYDFWLQLIANLISRMEDPKRGKKKRKIKENILMAGGGSSK